MDFKLDVASGSIVGGRAEQQDAFCVQSDTDWFLAAVCDGMGGMSYGGEASRVAISTLCDFLNRHSREFLHNIPDFFLELKDVLDEKVYELSRSTNCNGRVGTTIVMSVVSDAGLYWFSVGDSRLYIRRDSDVICATRDHNYLFTLNYLYKKGKLNRDYYEKECKEKGEMLTGFLGMGGIDFFDISRHPLALKPGDVFMLTSDGLYKTVDNDVIESVLCSDKSADGMLDELFGEVEKKNKKIRIIQP